MVHDANELARYNERIPPQYRANGWFVGAIKKGRSPSGQTGYTALLIHDAGPIKSVHVDGDGMTREEAVDRAVREMIAME